jgi:GT2 family glycosyltransferase
VRVRILPFKGEFNYSAMNNMAARQAGGSLLALVNNDIEVIDPGWLSEMVSHAIRPQIGAVGAKLLYPDERVQHAGVIVGLGSFAGHAFMLLSREDSGYYAHALLTRQVSAVTGACLLLRTSVFFEVGGLNETELKISLNDIDLCLKVQRAGYRNIFTPYAELIHHESVSRGYEDTDEKQARFRQEIQHFRNEWSEILNCDPFYNPNLTLDHSNYSPALRSRRTRPWFHEIRI